MRLMKEGKLLDERINYISDRLKEKYDDVWFGDKHWFILPNKEAIRVVGLGSGYNALLIEYAESQEEKDRNLSEDGDLYFIDDYTPEEMFDEMMKEIENEM